MIPNQPPISTYLTSLFWLLAGMIFIMVVLGGATRLTGSGLSMVEWKPLTLLPPIGETQWLSEFARYQTSPEFLKVHPDMTLPEFQSIFWLEYIHRLWGRALGLVLLIPTIIILLSRSFNHLRVHVLLLWMLGSAQGLLGWYMVKSGLVDDPHVSPYRLTAHLLLGFAIFWVAIKAALSVNEASTSRGYSTHQLNTFLRKGRTGLTLLLCTVCMGAFVAGLKAGLIYNTFPLMGESLIPEEVFFYSPIWLNFTENATTVQLLHRILATLTLGYLLWLAYTTHSQYLPSSVRRGTQLLVGLITIQYLLGILTLLYQVPIFLGTLHQGVALLVFGLLVFMIHTARVMKKS